MAITLYACAGEQPLARAIAKNLNSELEQILVRTFPDGESHVRVEAMDRVAGQDIAIVWPLDRPDDKVLPLWFAADALRDFGAARVGLVCPYLPYLRQDSRFQPGEALTSKSFATMMCGHVDWLVTVDPHLHRYKHLDEIYTIPTAIVQSATAIGAWIATHVANPLIIGPDEESEQWVAAVAGAARAPHLVLKKRRAGDRCVEIDGAELTNIPGGCVPVLVDDIVSTATTLVEAAKALHAYGLPAPVCVAIHAVFAGTAFTDLLAAGVRDIVTCNTIPHPSNRIDISGLIAAAIYRLGPTPIGAAA